MKWILRIAAALAILALAVPFVVLTAIGRMNPTEGFCVEQIDPKDFARFESLTEQELEQSYFNSPELAEPTMRIPWLEDDGTKPDPMKTTPEGDQAWWNATLPRRSMKRTLTAQQTAALQTLFADLPEYQMFNLDGVGIAIEAMHDGRREVRSTFLYPPPFKAGVLFSAVAKQSGIPISVLEQGHVTFATNEWKP